MSQHLVVSVVWLDMVRLLFYSDYTVKIRNTPILVVWHWISVILNLSCFHCIFKRSTLCSLVLCKYYLSPCIADSDSDKEDDKDHTSDNGDITDSDNETDDSIELRARRKKFEKKQKRRLKLLRLKRGRLHTFWLLYSSSGLVRDEQIFRKVIFDNFKK